MDIILIEGLKVETVVGCLAWEREILQPLILDLEILCDLSKPMLSDDLQDTINYAEICDLSTQIIQKVQPKLIEYAGYIVLKQLFERFLEIMSIKITIRKPAIIPQAQSVGICIERQRNDFCFSTGE